MSDFTFKTHAIPRHAGALAERVAVLQAMFPTSKMTDDAQVDAIAHKVLDLWRRRCNVLREAGWDKAQSVKFQYMRNCVPSIVCMKPEGAVSGSGSSRSCRQGMICPWCWARMTVSNVWETVTRVMERHCSIYDKDRTEYPYKLIVGTRNFKLPDNPSQPEDLLNEMELGMIRNKRAWARKAIGTMFLGVAHPDAKQWRYGTRTLALVPQAAKVGNGFRAVEHPTRRKVAEAVARFARYPRGMMFGDPEMTIRLLNVRGKYRLLRMSGVFSGQPRAGTSAGSDPDTRFLDL